MVPVNYFDNYDTYYRNSNRNYSHTLYYLISTSHKFQTRNDNNFI